MTVIAGSIKATLSSAVGGDGPASPLATAIEGLTEGHWDGIAENIFPPPGVDFEILYPIVPEASSNRFTFRDDQKSWRNVPIFIKSCCVRNLKIRIMLIFTTI